MKSVPPDHQYLITQLRKRGFHAVFRRWALGDTVFVGCCESRLDENITCFSRGAYLVPAAEGLWGIDIGVVDDAPVPLSEIIERVTRLLGHEDEFERELKRRQRALRFDRGSPAARDQ